MSDASALIFSTGNEIVRLHLHCVGKKIDVREMASLRNPLKITKRRKQYKNLLDYLIITLKNFEANTTLCCIPICVLLNSMDFVHIHFRHTLPMHKWTYAFVCVKRNICVICSKVYKSFSGSKRKHRGAQKPAPSIEQSEI